METYKKLPKKFKAKWIAGLRSGKYKQNGGKLCIKDEYYCCLGVAGKVAGVSNTYLKENGIFEKRFKGLPLTLVGKACNNNIIYNLTKMNDLQGKQFPEIADWIEENL